MRSSASSEAAVNTCTTHEHSVLRMLIRRSHMSHHHTHMSHHHTHHEHIVLKMHVLADIQDKKPVRGL